MEIRKPPFIEKKTDLLVVCLPYGKPTAPAGETYGSRKGDIRFCAGRRKKCGNVFPLSLLGFLKLLFFRIGS